MSKPSFSARLETEVDLSSVPWGDYAIFTISLIIEGSGRDEVSGTVFSTAELATTVIDENDYEVTSVGSFSGETSTSIIEGYIFHIKNINKKNKPAYARFKFTGEVTWFEWHGNQGVTHSQEYNKTADTYFQTWLPTDSVLRLAKDEILSTETVTALVDYPSEPEGFPAPTITLRSSMPSKTTITQTGKNTFTVGWNDYSLGVDTKITLTSKVSVVIDGVERSDESSKYLLIKPSLTGLDISKTEMILAYNNSFVDSCTVTPLPVGTGAPIVYYFTPLGDGANKISVSQNGATGVINGKYAHYSTVPVRVRAQLQNSSIYFDKTLNVQVRPNIKLQENGFKSGQPYIYDNGWKEAREVYIYENGWQINKVE